MKLLSGARRAAGAALILTLAACSGGGDGDASRELGLSTNSLTFSGAITDASAPAAQVITATIGAGAANVSAVHTGPAIASVSVSMSGTTAHITVTPSAPAKVGAGRFAGAVAITSYYCADAACRSLESGGTRTAAVTYQVSPFVHDVAPYIGVAGVEGTATIRGIGFYGFAIEGVRFGEVAATEKTVGSDTEIRVKYPALAAGTYPVTLDVPTHEGPIQGSATLTVIDPVTHTAQALAWPEPVTAVRALRYDAERGALLAATDSAGGSLVRYEYAGGSWAPPLNAAVPDLRDAALSTNGKQLIAVSDSRLTLVDPATLEASTTIDAPSLPENSYLKNLALLNSNQALVTTGIAKSEATPLYVFTVRSGEMIQLAARLNNSTPGASADGGRIVLVQGDPSLTDPPPVNTLNASSGTFGVTGLALNQNSIGPVLNRDATRLVLNGRNVYDGLFALLGKLPETTLAVALRPDGKRAYTYDTAAGGLLIFNISEKSEDEAYVALGAAVPVVAAPGEGVKMTISPDGNTLFLAGATQVVIQPTPSDP